MQAFSSARPRPPCRVIHLRRTTRCDILRTPIVQRRPALRAEADDDDHDDAKESTQKLEEDQKVEPLEVPFPGESSEWPGHAVRMGEHTMTSTPHSKDSTGLVTAALVRFAQWAFGENGLPQLELLAYGDFSQQGLWSKHSVVLCRNSHASESGLAWNFRRLRGDDLHLESLFQNSLEYLSACPANNITVR